MHSPEAETSRISSDLLLIEQALVQKSVVLECCAGFACDRVDFRVFVVVVLHRERSAFNERLQIFKAAAEFDGVTAWIQFDDLRIGLVGIERNAVTSLVEVVVETEEPFVLIVAPSGGRTCFS